MIAEFFEFERMDIGEHTNTSASSERDEAALRELRNDINEVLSIPCPRTRDVEEDNLINRPRIHEVQCVPVIRTKLLRPKEDAVVECEDSDEPLTEHV